MSIKRVIQFMAAVGIAISRHVFLVFSVLLLNLYGFIRNRDISLSTKDKSKSNPHPPVCGTGRESVPKLEGNNILLHPF